MICACFCVVINILNEKSFIIFADFCSFFKSKNSMQKNTLTSLVSVCFETKTILSMFCKISRVGHL